MGNKRLTFNSDELNLIADSGIILLKKSAIEKVVQLFHECGSRYQQEFPESISAYKISRGEAYRNLPYVVLDAPKIVSKNFDFVCRTLFWWGNFFSHNFIVRTEMIEEDTLHDEQIQNWQVLTDSEIWNNQLNSEAYCLVSMLDPGEKSELVKQTYIRFGQTISLQDYDEIENKGVEFYRHCLRLMKS